MIELEINDRTISVSEGTSIIDAADRLDIYIPRFCYHRKLSVVANCRMCLVEVANVPKPLPACATLVTQGMKVYTQSKKALDAQRAVMEFLLINHPLDCPICDQGGECELQDQALGYGNATSHYHRAKRSVVSQDIGPLIATDMTRCIHCTRCIRVSEEICGVREMGATFRGGDMEIGTYVARTIQSELSGNMIDVCPVGALTSKPYSFHGRPWELTEHAMVAPHDCWGSSIYVHTRGREYQSSREIMRVVPRENEAINEVWLSDRDRFSYTGLNHTERLSAPLMKKNGQWESVSWERALHEVADRLAGVKTMQAPDQIGAILSPNVSVEVAYLAAKLMRDLGSPHVDHRIRECDVRDQEEIEGFPGFSLPLEDLETCDRIFLVGTYLRKEVPLANYKVLKATQDEAEVYALNFIDYPFNYPIARQIITHPAQLTQELAAVYRALCALKGVDLSKEPHSSVLPSESAVQIAEGLNSGKKVTLILGLMALHHPEASILRQIAKRITDLTGGHLNLITEGCNSAGAWLAGAVPHREAGGKPVLQPGRSVLEMFRQGLRAYLLVDVEPEHDVAHPAQALAALESAALVVCLNSFVTPAMRTYADFILPIAPFTETDGTYVNVGGTWQFAHAASVPEKEAKPAWKIWRVLAHFLELPGFDFECAHEIAEHVQSLNQAVKVGYRENRGIDFPLAARTAHLQRVGVWFMVRSDALVRRAPCLQTFVPKYAEGIVTNKVTADAHGLEEGMSVVAEQEGSTYSAPLKIDDRLPDDVVWIPMAMDSTQGFGEAMGEISLKRGQL